MKPFITIKEIKELISKKEITPKEIISFYSDRIKKYNKDLGSILEVFDNQEATENGALSAIPGVIKDNINKQNQIASCGSRILRNYTATYNATVVNRIEKEGGIIIGRANMDEFAMGGSGEYSSYYVTRNPWNKNCVPGGSSSGPAAAVAAGLVPWALGSETGGSVRQPASFCNLVGLYPTYGSVSRYGLVAFASSNDQVGPLTKTVYDNALLANTIIGHDPKDATSLHRPKVDFTKNLTGKLPENLTIGVIKDSIESDGVNDEVKTAFKAAVEQLEKMGAKIKYIEIPDLKYAISVYYIVAPAEAASNLSRYDGTLYGMRIDGSDDLKQMYIKTRHDGFGMEVKRRILMGNYVLSSKNKDAFYNKADHMRAMIRAELETAFKGVDLLTSPTSPVLPFKIGEKSSDPLAMYMADYFTIPNCITGNPGLNLGCGFSKEGLPIGFQFIGPRLSEDLIYQVAYAYEQSTDHHLKNPTGF